MKKYGYPMDKGRALYCLLMDRYRKCKGSGNGAHIWIFFKEAIQAKTAREFGSALLTKGAETVKMRSFRSYDRMIPLQDHLPEGGLGNLVALPLQGQSLKNGNSAFVDEDWNAYPNQWDKLVETEKLEKSFVEEKIKEWSEDVRSQMKAVTDDKSVILVATGQYIGEGFNFPRLDTMMLTMPVSWSGIVEQYAGRLHRDYEGKKEVVIYDYVDSHIRVLEKMYHKRLTTYRKMGYEICSSPVVNTGNTNAVFDKDSYLNQYRTDLYNARNEIIVSSPGVNETSVKNFIDMTEWSQQNGTKITVVTLSPDSYPEERIEKIKDLVKQLEQAGIRVVTRDRMHEHFTLIDNNVVWYGSLNFLSRAKDDDDLIRIEDKEVAHELMEMTFSE